MNRSATSRVQKARELVEAIALAGCALITGASPGAAVRGGPRGQVARRLTVGISPGLSNAEHITKYGSPCQGFDVLIYAGSGLMGREVENICSSDIVIIDGGRSGTLGEFAIAYDEGKLIGVLRATGGIAAEVEMLERSVRKEPADTSSTAASRPRSWTSCSRTIGLCTVRARPASVSGPRTRSDQ